MSSSVYLDWAITGIFYTSLQYVDAYLSTKDIHPRDHKARTSWVFTEHNLKTIFNEYQYLKDESEAARYLLKAFTSNDVIELTAVCEKIKNFILPLIST